MKTLSAWLLQSGTERAHLSEDEIEEGGLPPSTNSVVPLDELFVSR